MTDALFSFPSYAATALSSRQAACYLGDGSPHGVLPIENIARGHLDKTGRDQHSRVPSPSQEMIKKSLEKCGIDAVRHAVMKGSSLIIRDSWVSIARATAAIRITR